MIFSQRDSNGELSVSEVKKSLWKKLTVKDFQVIPIKCSKAVAMKRFLIVAEETNLHLRRNCSVDLIHTQTKYKS